MATTVENFGYLGIDGVGGRDIAKLVIGEIIEARDKIRENSESIEARSKAAIAIRDSFEANAEFFVYPGAESNPRLLRQGVLVGREAVGFVAKNVANIGNLSEFINGEDVLIIHGTDFEVKSTALVA
jgi:hypothetical protein